jgi:hypothetical protein
VRAAPLVACSADDVRLSGLRGAPLVACSADDVRLSDLRGAPLEYSRSVRRLSGRAVNRCAAKSAQEGHNELSGQGCSLYSAAHVFRYAGLANRVKRFRRSNRGTTTRLINARRATTRERKRHED